MAAAFAERSPRRYLGAALALVALLFAVTATPARADDVLGPAAITSDRPDYAPGDHVVLTGTGWGIAEVVHVTVLPSDPGVPSPYEGDVTAGIDGGFTLEFDLPMMFVADYTVTATGASGAVATTTFTDGDVLFNATRVPAAGTLSVAVGGSTTFSVGARKAGTGSNPVVTGVRQKNNPNGTCGGKQSDIPTSWLAITAPSLPQTLSSTTSDTSFTISVTVPPGTTTGQYTSIIEFATQAQNTGGGAFDLCLDVTAANIAPTVARDNATVTVNEGLAASNTGTYSDANSGDSVALSASVGTVTKTGTNSGTWSWGFATTDGTADSQTVTITANDGHGGVTTTTFALVVNNLAPTATFNAPSSVQEGSPIGLSLTSPVDVAADLGTLQYAFDCGSGTFGALSSTSSASCPTSDQGSRTVRGKVRDKDGGEMIYTATTTITNVAPTGVLANDGPVAEGSAATVSYSGQSDPSPVDTAAGFHYAFSCANGDLSGATYAGSGTSSSTTCTFADDGSYPVKGRIIDKDGGFTETTTTVTVTNVDPVVTAANDQLANEGSATSFNLGSFVDPGDDDPWHVTVDWGDGTTDTTLDASTAGALPATLHTYDDDGEYTVTVTVAEDGPSAPFGSATFTAKIANVAPTATPDFESPVDEGSSFALALTDATDVSAADVAASFEYAFDCGDGNGYGGFEASASTSCNTDDNGTRNVGAKIKDKDDGVREYTSTVTVHNVAPTATLANDSPIGEGSSATVTFTDQFDPSSADTDAGLHYAYACDNGDLSGATYAGSGASPSTSCPFSDDGTFTVKARIIDKDGGYAERTTAVTVNNLPPSITAVTNDGPVDEGSSASVDVTATDPAGASDPLTYDFDCTTDGVYESLGNATGSGSCTYTDDGVYTVTVRVSDDDGGVTTGTTVVTVDNVVPVVTAPATQTADEGSSMSFDLGSFLDPGDDGPWHVTVDWGDSTADTTIDESAPGTIGPQSHTFDDNGTHTVTVTVAEHGDSAPFGSATFTVNVANVEPTATTDFETPVDEGSSFALKLTAPSDPSGADTAAGFTYAFDCGDGAGYSAYDSSPTRTCGTTDDGTRTVKAKIRDKDGGESVYTESVVVENVEPTATRSFDATAAEGSPFALALISPSDASSVDTAAGFTYAFDCGSGSGYGPYGTASSTTCPTTDNGTRSVGARIKDKDGGVSEYTGSVTVTNVNPAATLGNNGSKPEGSPVTVSFSGQSDPSAADTSAGFHYAYSCTNGDLTGATYGGASTSASTTCTFADDGTYVVKARIIDKDNGFTEHTTSVTVTNVAPAVTPPADGTGDEGVAKSFALGSFTDPGDDGPWTITVAWGDGSTPTTFTSGTGTIAAQSHTYGDNGTYTVTVTATEAGSGVPPRGSGTFRVVVANIAPSVTSGSTSQSLQYSDQIVPVTITATDVAADTLTLTPGTPSGSPLPGPLTVTPAAAPRTWILAGRIDQPAGTYVVRVSIKDEDGGTGYIDISFTVTREDAALSYTGDSIGLSGANLTLQATVKESDSVVGDITKMWVRFEVSPAATCGSSPTVKYAQVVDTSPSGDGTGTASTTFSGSEGPYCISMSIVAGGGGSNGYYVADIEDATVTFFEDIGRFVTGGGWVADSGASGNGKGNFGFVGKYNKNGSPKGQMVYVYRGTYNGMPAIFRVKSNSLDALGFSGGPSYPLSATLQGKASLQVVSAATGAQLYSQGGLTFVAAVVDGGKPSSVDGDTFSLTLTGGFSKSVGVTQLSGGNVVIHLK